MKKTAHSPYYSESAVAVVYENKNTKDSYVRKNSKVLVITCWLIYMIAVWTANGFFESMLWAPIVVLFHVLDGFGYSDLAWHIITRTDYPSYGNWVDRGATTLWESFFSGKDDGLPSLNQHFWGDVSAWFLKCVAGIRVNPTRRDPHAVLIRPAFVRNLDSADAYHITTDGRVSVSRRREADGIYLTVDLPKNADAYVSLLSGYAFEDGTAVRSAEEGKNTFRIHEVF